jgi:hypothetical protein
MAKAWRNPAASTTSTPGITLDDGGSFNRKTMPNSHRDRGRYRAAQAALLVPPQRSRLRPASSRLATDDFRFHRLAWTSSFAVDRTALDFVTPAELARDT